LRLTNSGGLVNSLIGIQVPVVSLVDKGFPEALDRLNEIGVNAVFVGSQAFDRGVRRESARTVAAVAGKARVYPGIDVDVAAPAHVVRSTPESVGASLAAAFEAGADGVIISRTYSEMDVKNQRLCLDNHAAPDIDEHGSGPHRFHLGSTDQSARFGGQRSETDHHVGARHYVVEAAQVDVVDLAEHRRRVRIKDEHVAAEWME
jgi:hypothetical protein